jgi:sugar/nucleoside kinase (ribokinase family)
MDAAVFGNIVADVIGAPIDLRHPPQIGGLRFIDSIRIAAGGNVCNVGIAMARLGMRVAGAGLVGDDILGRAMIEQLNAAGVDTTLVLADPRAQTSASMVAIAPGGERTFHTVRGVADAIDAEFFQKCIPTFVRCAWVQIAYFGFLPKLEPHLPALLAELRRLAPRTRIAMDTLNPPSQWSLLEPILPHLDVLAPSLPEAGLLSGESDPSRIVRFFRQSMKHGIIGIKLGQDGGYFDDGKKAFHAPAYKVDVADTIGAGDAWFAGLLAALHRGIPLEQAARFANRVGADSCTAIGASAGVRSFPESFERI